MASANPTATSHGVLSGYWAEVLWEMMQHLDYEKRPTYQGFKTKVGGQTFWRLEVILYASLAASWMPSAKVLRLIGASKMWNLLFCARSA